MSYTALYRKFRPGEFEEVKGQDHIVTTLRNQIRTDRIGHAYLFCGTRGTGKTTVAKILAKAVNCENPMDGSPCGECDMCKKIASQTSMNVVEIDAASNNGVANIRDIIEEVQYSPTEGRFKVYIIDEVHMLSSGAFNALLKTLEEPPEYVIFILATTEAHKIPITILSRCQRYDFKRISIDTIADRLQDLVGREQVQAEEKALRYIAKAADGSMRDALSLLDQCIAFYLGEELTYDKTLEVLGAVDTEVYSRMYSYVIEGNVVECIKLIDEMIMAGRDLNQFVSEFIWYLRGLMLLDASEQSGDILDVSTERLEQMRKEAKKVDTEVLIRYIHILSDLPGQLRFATQKRVLVEITWIKLCKPQMDTAQDLTTIKSRLSQIEKQLEEGVAVVSQPANSESPKAQEESVEEKPKILPKAVPEDVRRVLEKWNDVMLACDAVMRNMLSQAKKVVSDEGVLILQFTDTLNEAYLKQDEGKALESLQQIISNFIGKDVTIQTRTVDAQTDARYQDVMDLINFDKIEVQ
ncbi:MAG: DNA polymerase III subunit gamma/tau [Lachnospiraceae bacterium]|nr:DNA polymerase III subunit gamma/tau [Lachnospiraceae bacterium]